LAVDTSRNFLGTTPVETVSVVPRPARRAAHHRCGDWLATRPAHRRRRGLHCRRRRGRLWNRHGGRRDGHCWRNEGPGCRLSSRCRTRERHGKHARHRLRSRGGVLASQHLYAEERKGHEKNGSEESDGQRGVQATFAGGPNGLAC